MTKAEAKKLGSKVAEQRAEWLYTDIPYHRLAEVLQKYRKPKTWREEAAESSQLQRGLLLPRDPIPADLMPSFTAGYVFTGAREIERYIREAKSEGLLKETKGTVRGL